MTSVGDRWHHHLERLERKSDPLVPCVFRALFGVRCPGCGMTHAVLAALQGDLHRARRHNPFVVVLPFVVGWASFDTLRRLRMRSSR